MSHIVLIVDGATVYDGGGTTPPVQPPIQPPVQPPTQPPVAGTLVGEFVYEAPNIPIQSVVVPDGGTILFGLNVPEGATGQRGFQFVRGTGTIPDYLPHVRMSTIVNGVEDPRSVYEGAANLGQGFPGPAIPVMPGRWLFALTVTGSAGTCHFQQILG